jgi:uncharacterized hydrophobic protein (TIGR00271 family)
MLRAIFQNLFDVSASTDYEGSTDNIESGIRLRGLNLWMLLASALLASIGLNTNSTAVIIGAMLISPLMNPIVGVGYSVARLNRPLLGKSVRNLVIAVAGGLGISFLYFLLSPINEPTAELLARTRPTLLDVLIAFAGGFAGMLALTRKGLTNALPGVAIATALMPPLCTAGYGLANLDLGFALGGFYLFSINAFFIAFAAFLVIRFLGFNAIEDLSPSLRRKAIQWTLGFSFVFIAPSIYFLVDTSLAFKRNQQLKQIINTKIEAQGYDLFRYEQKEVKGVSQLRLYLLQKPLAEVDRKALEQQLLTELGDSIQVRAFVLEAEPQLRDLVLEERLNQLALQVQEQQDSMRVLQTRLDSLKRQNFRP